MSLQPKPRRDFADWLAAERASTQGRSEYLDGEVYDQVEFVSNRALIP